MTDYYPSANSSGPKDFNTLEPGLARVHKRIIVCCDGLVSLMRRLRGSLAGSRIDIAHRTWEDALYANARWKYSNVTVHVSHSL